MKNAAVMVAQLLSATPKAAYPIAQRPVVNVGSIAGEPVDAPRMALNPMDRGGLGLT
jgi:hypothetical protein